MKSPKLTGDDGRWERTIARYMASYGLPIKWNYRDRKFTGLRLFTIKRVAPMRARIDESQSWTNMPRTIKQLEDRGHSNLIVIATNRHYGDSIEDSLVITRLGTFMPLMQALVENDRERWLDAGDSSR